MHTLSLYISKLLVTVNQKFEKFEKVNITKRSSDNDLYDAFIYEILDKVVAKHHTFSYLDFFLSKLDLVVK